MTGISASGLRQAVAAWDAHAAADPVHADQMLRQPAYFLVTPSSDIRYRPLRALLAWLRDVPFERSGGRSRAMAQDDPALAALGFARVDENSPFFQAIFDDWVRACLAAGGPLSSHIGTDPRTGRVFYVAPGPL